MAESHRQLVDGRGKRPAQVLSLVFGKRAYRSSLSCPPSPGHATSSTTTHRRKEWRGLSLASCYLCSSLAGWA